jgi:hypothetical protein
MAEWVIAMPDWFGPTLYFVGHDAEWVFGKEATAARIYSDDEKASATLLDGCEWKPASDLAECKSGERKEYL